MPEQEKTELASTSDELFVTIQRLNETEQRKRRERIASETFHRLANEVDALSHEVFAIARDQRDIGEGTQRVHESIDDVAEQTSDAAGRRDG